ncbi:mitochondria fission 1 protein [Ramicandelaber brevisporus]|nr:mitochondria fission 1 protein [Ramicandelaber brevisporus]
MSLPEAVDAESPLLPEELAVLRRQYDRELPSPSVQSTFNYAWGLVKSNRSSDQRLGLNMMRKIHDNHPDRARECLYYIALGHYKLGEYTESKELADRMLESEPSNSQAKSLRELVEARVAKEGLLGMAIVGATVAAAAIVVSAIVKKNS